MSFTSPSLSGPAAPLGPVARAQRNLLWVRDRASGVRRRSRILAAAARGRATVRVGGVRAAFRVASMHEARRILTLWGERPVLQWLTESVQPGDVFYDIGANIGVYTVILGRAIGPQGKVISFEPEPVAYERMRENVALNSLENVQLLSCALGDQNEERTLHIVGGLGEGRHSLVREEGTPHTVQVFRGDYLIQTRELPEPSVVKVDVEGHELAVLLGLTEVMSIGKCRVVCCETDPAGEGPITDLLHAWGFSEVTVYPRGLDRLLLAHR